MPHAFDRFIHKAQTLRGSFFQRESPVTAARAPAWIDLLGGAVPGTGPLALGWPLGGGTFVALQPDAEAVIRLRLADGALAALPLATLVDADGAPHAYEVIAAELAAYPEPVRLVAAAYAALLREEFVRVPGGARVFVQPGASPTTSVGLAAATAQALVTAYGVRISPRELGLSLRAGLRGVIGAAGDPGDLGAIVSVCAPGGSLLLLHQQPAWMWGNLHLPAGNTIWAIRARRGPRAGAPLALGAAAMAYRLAVAIDANGPQQAHARWQGYLANLGAAVFAGELRTQLPPALAGADFLAKHGPLPGLDIDPTQVYPVQAVATLAVEEHLRARSVAALLRAAASKAQRDENMDLVGELMAQSHAAQVAAGMLDPDADALAARVYAAGPSQGLWGARAPAAASGATLVVLGRAEAEPGLRALVERYAVEINQPVSLYGGTSSGCSPAGTREA